MKVKNSSAFLACTLFGVIAIALWPANINIGILLLVADAIVMAFVLFHRVIKNEAVLILYLVLSYYIFPFPANAFLGALDPLDVTIVQTLSARGYEFPVDTILYSSLLIVFKNTFVLACGNAVVGRTATLTRRAGETKQHWVSVTALLLVLIMTEMLISHAFLNIALSFLLIYLAVHVARRLLERTDFSIGWTVAIIAGMSIVSFALTRSREPIAIVFLFLVFLHANRTKEGPWKFVAMILGGLFLVILYGALRDGGSMSAVLGMAGIEALGESGTVAFIGSHPVGLGSRDLLPAEVDGSIFPKSAPCVPFF